MKIKLDVFGVKVKLDVSYDELEEIRSVVGDLANDVKDLVAPVSTIWSHENAEPFKSAEDRDKYKW